MLAALKTSVVVVIGLATVAVLTFSAQIAQAYPQIARIGR
jgi:hypothetical protein